MLVMKACMYEIILNLIIKLFGLAYQHIRKYTIRNINEKKIIQHTK